MNSERHQKVSELFQAVQEIPPAERSDFLAARCAGDDDLRQQVESLMAAAATLFEAPAVTTTLGEQPHLTDRADHETARVGGQIGHYKIVSHLGTGGMGEVWLADDARLNRLVALKLLSAVQLPNKQDRLQRFEQEARAVSALNHPNIITIFDIGQTAGWQFIATEYVAGETLRQRYKEKPLTVAEAVDVAVQIAAALAAAHSANIVHRDIKPENVMLRRDGIVKVLDFGLARFTQKNSLDNRAETITKPGLVMGTVGYMSPEQARGLTVDERTDIFSLGIVLYEMMMGKTPFRGGNEIEVLAAILNQEPAPPSDYLPDALKIVIANALEKDRAERYQTAAEMLADLRVVKRSLEFEGELKTRVTADDLPVFRNNRRALLTEKNTAPRQTLANAPVVNWFYRRKIPAALIVLLLCGVGLASYTRFAGPRDNPKTQAPVLSDTDQILIADFANKTGDEDFDRILRQPLAVGLAQSPFISLVSDGQIRQTLKLMDKPSDTVLVPEVAREICERRGVKAFLQSSIENYGVQYLITLEVFNSADGASIAREQAEAKTKTDVLAALDGAAIKLREKLGESLASIEKFDAPIQTSTSPSLEALKTYTAAFKTNQSGRSAEAIPLLKRAIELDPNFAAAYGAIAVTYYNQEQNGLAAEYAEKAYALRDRATEREKLRFTDFYYAFVTGEMDKDIETLELYKQTYPRDNLPPGNLSSAYTTTGDYPKAEENARLSMQMDPTPFVPYTNLGKALLRQSRFDEAQAVFEDGLKRGFENVDFNEGLFSIAFVKQDEAAMRQQIEAMKGKPSEESVFLWQGSAALFGGRWREYEKFIKQAVSMVAKDSPDLAADYSAQAAVSAAALAKCGEAQAWASRALKFDRGEVILQDAALSLALCGVNEQPLVNELKTRFPKSTVSNEIWLPIISAAKDVRGGSGGNPEKSLQALEVTRKYEGAANFWEVYLRGQAYLKLGQSHQALAEFQKIINNRGWGPQSPLYPLASLGMAETYALQGDRANLAQAVANFSALWKNADADAPALKTAAALAKK